VVVGHRGLVAVAQGGISGKAEVIVGGEVNEREIGLGQLAKPVQGSSLMQGGFQARLHLAVAVHLRTSDMAKVESLLLTATSILKTGVSASSVTSAGNSELILSITSLLDQALPGPDSPDDSPSCALDAGCLFVPNPDQLEPSELPEFPREQLEVTVKFWYLSGEAQKARTYDPQWALTALDRLKDTIELDSVDNFILQVPNIAFDQELLADETQEDQFNTSVQDVYSVRLPGRPYVMFMSFQAIARSPAISRMGLSEFSLARLKRFISSLPEGVKPPRVNHVNLRNCCKVPADLTEYAKEQDLELYIHSDSSSACRCFCCFWCLTGSTDLLTKSTFTSLLEQHQDRLPEEIRSTYRNLKARWVLKVRG
jgi:diketogulonate reductase-like aldo/keto reductase